jgi:hypothetical protein
MPPLSKIAAENFNLIIKSAVAATSLNTAYPKAAGQVLSISVPARAF